MYTILSIAGRAALTSTLTSTSKLNFTRFQIGQLTGTSDEPLPTLRNYPHDVDYYNLFPWLETGAWITSHFVVRYEGAEAAMSWLPLAADQVVLKCYTPPATDLFHYNAVLLWAEYEGTEFLFSASYYGVTNPKFNIEISQGGMKHYFMTNLWIDNIDDKFDWTNLAFEVPTIEWKDTVFDFDFAHKEARDQFILGEHYNVTDGTPVLVVNTQEQFYGVHMYAYDPTAPESSDLPSLFTTAPLRSVVNNVVLVGYHMNYDAEWNPILDFRGRPTQVPIGDDPDPYPYLTDPNRSPVLDPHGQLIFTPN